MFRKLDNDAAEVEFELDGEPVTVPAGISIAAAMLYLDAIPFRQTLQSASPRAAFCMMGACFECLVEIDGMSNQRACQQQVEAGMQVRRQLSFNGSARE
ncbi:MAG: (2Fe-2S)-binding protein [Gammaproteobacteria bacterium]|nr:(2Fe-2S)-binding protein [Gammaproteobacteria bacterium]MCP4984073.1 (2Fe-2S)-binding protein [Gammaproteobacteria bacterium]